MRTIALLTVGLVAGLLLHSPARDAYRSLRPRPPESAERQPHRHLANLREIERGPRERGCVLLGDSILDYWRLSPDLQAETFGADCLNLGVGSDRIENALWRIQHGELSGYTARNVVVCLGANDRARGRSDDAIASDLAALLDEVRRLQPHANLLVVDPPTEHCPDGLHPSPDGYRAWGETIRPRLK